MLLFIIVGCPAPNPRDPGRRPAITVEPSSVERDAISAAAARPPPPVPMKNESTQQETFRATVRIDAQPAGKMFQGVWLERSDGERWLIAYRPWEYWTPFQDKQVDVTGERYQPEGQSVSAVHFRLDRLTIDTAAMTSLVRVERERGLTGVFLVDKGGPPGSKMAGYATSYFRSDDGERFLLANAPQVTPGTPVRITAREVELSPFSAHQGGRHLWVIDVLPRP
jgi:hypothetical protein